MACKIPLTLGGCSLASFQEHQQAKACSKACDQSHHDLDIATKVTWGQTNAIETLHIRVLGPSAFSMKIPDVTGHSLVIKGYNLFNLDLTFKVAQGQTQYMPELTI